LHGLGFANSSQQSLSTSCTRDDSKIDLGLAEAGVLPRNQNVSAHSQFAASAECEAIDCGNNRFGETCDGLPVAHTRVIEDAYKIAVSHFFNIRTGSKSPAATRYDHYADVVVDTGCGEDIRQLPEQLCIERIQGVRSP
jgi:hypothetical protein